LLPLLAPYQLLIETGWQIYLNLFFLFALLVSMGAMAVSAFFIFFALAAYSRRMVIDHQNHRVVYGDSHVFRPYRERSYPFEELASVEIDIHDWSDGPPSFSLTLRPKGNHEFSIGYFDQRAQAEQYRDAIAAWIGLA
jgi:hypothetical protein